MATAKRQQPPKQQQPNPEELIQVAFTTLDGTRHPAVKLPRRLISSGTQRAKQDWLIAHGEIPDPNAPELPAMDEPAQIQQAVIDDARARAIESRLDAVEQRPLPATPDAASLERLAISVQRAALSKEEIVQVADEATGRIDTVASGFEERLQTAESREQALISTVSSMVSESQGAVAGVIQSLEQRSAAIRSEALEAAETNAIEVATKEGRKAAKQAAEAFRPSSVTIASEDPRDVDENSWALRHYGFEGGLVAGDGVFVTSVHGITAMVYKGPQQGWIETAELLPRVVTATGPSITDNSKPQYSTIIQSGKGSSGGPSSIRLMASTAARGAATRIADTSNYAAVNLGGTPHSGKLLVQVTDTGTARVGVVTIDFIVNAAGILDQTDSALLGELFSGTNPPEVNLQGTIRAPQIPAGITPPAAGTIRTQALQLDLTVGAGIGIGGPYLLAGDLSLAFEGGDTPIDLKTGVMPTPLWVWS